MRVEASRVLDASRPPSAQPTLLTALGPAARRGDAACAQRAVEPDRELAVPAPRTASARRARQRRRRALRRPGRDASSRGASSAHVADRPRSMLSDGPRPAAVPQALRRRRRLRRASAPREIRGASARPRRGGVAATSRRRRRRARPAAMVGAPPPGSAESGGRSGQRRRATPRRDCAASRARSSTTSGAPSAGRVSGAAAVRGIDVVRLIARGPRSNSAAAGDGRRRHGVIIADTTLPSSAALYVPDGGRWSARPSTG